MQHLADLLAKRGWEEPPEVGIIQSFLAKHYQATALITVQERQIIIAVKGSALAGAIRPQLHLLQEACHTDKKLVLRIG
jgi:hypothetical protein